MMISTVCITQVSAQGIAIGGKLGFTASSFRGDDAVNLKVRNGVVGGAFLNAGFLKFLAIQPEVIFRQSGATYTYDALGVDSKIKVNYLSVPVVFKAGIPIDETFYPHILIGPQYSFALSRTYSVGNNDGQVEFEDADINKNDVGGFFGVGLDIRSKRLFWTIDFRYGMGAIQVSDNDNANLDLKNQDFTISTGVGFRLTK